MFVGFLSAHAGGEGGTEGGGGEGHAPHVTGHALRTLAPCSSSLQKGTRSSHVCNTPPLAKPVLSPSASAHGGSGGDVGGDDGGDNCDWAVKSAITNAIMNRYSPQPHLYFSFRDLSPKKAGCHLDFGASRFQPHKGTSHTSPPFPLPKTSATMPPHSNISSYNLDT